MIRRILFCLIAFFMLISCKKDEFTNHPSAKLSFSTREIFFDTIFTSFNSVTAKLKVFNNNKDAVRISEIKLFGGDASPYQLNINGQATSQLTNIELQGNDSLTIFIRAKINPDGQKLPFMVADSIGFLTNGNRQLVRLKAYAQNVRLLKNEVISTSTEWENDIPYVVYNDLTIAENQTLTIKKGCRIYFHKDAKMVVSGTLKVDGSLTDTVTFSGDRIERLYQEEPGQWKGIHFLGSSKNNLINYATIKNAITGIQVDSLSNTTEPKLLLVNSIIKNMQVAGIAGYKTDITGFNNLIYNCGQYLIYGVYGGKYNLKQNTFANYNYVFARRTPALYITNQHPQNNSVSDLELILVNNIIWGTLSNELEIVTKGTVSLDIKSNLIKSTDNTLNTLGNILNSDPGFIASKEGNFYIKANSTVIGKGSDLSTDPYYSPWLRTDLKGNNRLFPSFLGCYNFF